MTDKEITDAIAAGLKPINERFNTLESRLPAAARATETRTTDADANLVTLIASAVGTAIKPFADKLEKSEASALKAQASAAIKPHITRGAIAPADTDAITLWETAWIANAKSAEAQMAKLPGFKNGRIVTASAQDHTATEVEPDAAIMTEALKIAKASEGKVTNAAAVIAVARSAEGQKNYMEFRKQFAANGQAN